MLELVARTPWLEIVQTIAPVATAGIAYKALRNWQRQDKAKREAEFLDDLVESAHTYIVEIYRPIALVRSAKIGMASHVENWSEGNEEEKAIKGAIAYVSKRGEEDGRQLAASLSAVDTSVVKLRSLLAKGQVFGFLDYNKAQNAITRLTWQYDRIASFTSMIRSPTWNWEHPDVRSLLVKVMAIEPDEIRKRIGEENAALLEFARETYGRIYG